MLVVALGVSCREPFGELAVLRGEIADVCDLLWAMGTSKESGEALEVEIEQAEPNQKDDLMVSHGAHFASWSFPPFKGQLFNVRCMIGTQQNAKAQAFEMLSFRSPFLHDVGAISGRFAFGPCLQRANAGTRDSSHWCWRVPYLHSVTFLGIEHLRLQDPSC